MFVFSGSPACHQDVVQVHEQEVQILEDGIHQTLKSLGGVLEPERHTEELKEPEQGDHCRLGDVVGVDRNLMITTDEVHFTENVLPARSAVKSWMRGIGYRSSSVIQLSFRKSPHGR